MEAVTAIQVQPQRAISRAIDFSPEQRKMIRDTFANGASESEFAVLMEVAKVRGLNPLLRQIYFVKRWDGTKKCEVWSTQISIDGLRAVAERTGIYAGQDEPEYIEKDGKLGCCKVRVYRKDWGDRPAVGVAYFEEYAQSKRDGGLTTFWATKPHIMLAKCAEALAIRKAFPEDTAGLYVPEEMGETPAIDVTPAPTAQIVALPTEDAAPPPPRQTETTKAAAAIGAARRNQIWKEAQGIGLTKETFPGWIEKTLGVAKKGIDLTPADMDRLEAELKAPKDIDY